jgi:Helix-turn-helix of DDE superfamily endonuclease
MLFLLMWLLYIERYTLSGRLRQRKYSPRQEDGLSTDAEKLFFILYYLKNMPSQEALAASFDLEQDMANKWIHILSPILEKALKKFTTTSKTEQINQELIENQTYIIDATERAVQRDTYQQEEFYSGKKKSIRSKICC